MKRPSDERLLGFAEGMEGSAEILLATLVDVEAKIAAGGFSPGYCCTKSMRELVTAVADALNGTAAGVRKRA